jgi:hypothetical protein
MRNQDYQEAETTSDPRLWTYAQAVRALPYLRSVTRSLREHWLEMQQARQQIRRMDARPSRPNRQTLLLREKANREAALAEENYVETLRELTALGIYSRDPANGLILVPFRDGDNVAWVLFEMFAPQGQEFSSFPADPVGTRGTLDEKLDPGLVDEVFSSAKL